MLRRVLHEKFAHYKPPTAVPIFFRGLLQGLIEVFRDKKYLNKLESEIKEYFGVKPVVLVSTGRAALIVILKALFRIAGSTHKNEVLILAYTCYSVLDYY